MTKSYQQVCSECTDLQRRAKSWSAANNTSADIIMNYEKIISQQNILEQPCLTVKSESKNYD